MLHFEYQTICNAEIPFYLWRALYNDWPSFINTVESSADVLSVSVAEVLELEAQAAGQESTEMGPLVLEALRLLIPAFKLIQVAEVRLYIEGEG